MHIDDFQKAIEKTYFNRDSARGMGGTFMWFMEEVGELSTALREEDKESQMGEFADVFAWLCSLASMAGIRMEDAIAKYSVGCPACHHTPCDCSEKN